VLEVLKRLGGALNEMRMEMDDIRAGQAQASSTSSFSLTPSAFPSVEGGSRAAVQQPQPQPQTSNAFRPKMSDLSEYHGASGKLDDWLAELRTMARLCKMAKQDIVDFAAARMRGAALHWWEGMSADAQAAITDTTLLAAALRKRFQPITASETARARLRKLQQSTRSTDDYILEFQELYAKVPDMSAADALFDFMHGLHKTVADQLRIQGVKTINDAYETAARVSGLTTQAHHAPPANALTGIFPKDDNTSTTQQQYPRNNTRGYRGGRGGGRAPFNRGAEGQQRAPPTTAPLIPQEVREKRREQGACFRCGQSGHMARACPNAVSVSLN
jgi:hypothetical protein